MGDSLSLRAEKSRSGQDKHHEKNDDPLRSIKTYSEIVPLDLKQVWFNVINLAWMENDPL